MFDIAIESLQFLKEDGSLKIYAYVILENHIQSEEMMRQKINYVHNNPVRRGYVDDVINWVYSSARNYLKEDYSVLAIDLFEL